METTSFLISDGQAVSTAINHGVELPSSADRFEVALFWPEEDLVDGADIVLHVESPHDGMARTRSDSSYDTRKRIHMEGSAVSGKCLAVVVEALHIPTSASRGDARRRVYLAWYYEDSSRDELDAAIR